MTAGTLLALGDAIQQMRERRAGLLKAKVKAASYNEGIVPVYQSGMLQVTPREWDWARTGLYLYTLHIVNTFHIRNFFLLKFISVNLSNVAQLPSRTNYYLTFYIRKGLRIQSII